MLAWPSGARPRLAKTYPSLAQATLQTVGDRLQHAHARVRAARCTGCPAAREGCRRKVERGTQIDFPISRQDIAGMTGTTLHTVSRILSAWEDQGIVEGGRQRIVLVR
jgi:CRP-like cAMP-binding protein